MNGLEKFEYITHWYATNNKEEPSKLNAQENVDLISQIEGMLEETIPDDIREVFIKYDGEDKAECILDGHDGEVWGLCVHPTKPEIFATHLMCFFS